MTQVHIPLTYRYHRGEAYILPQPEHVGMDSVPHREAARTPHDVPVVRGSPEFQFHGIRPFMHALALDLEGVFAIILDD